MAWGRNGEVSGIPSALRLRLVAANQGIAFVPRSFKVPSELVAYRDLDEDGSDIIASLVWAQSE